MAEVTRGVEEEFVQEKKARLQLLPSTDKKWQVLSTNLDCILENCLTGEACKIKVQLLSKVVYEECKSMFGVQAVKQGCDRQKKKT